jgi:hypothetical protein
MGISGVGPNGFLWLAGRGGMGILCMQVRCGWEWVVTHTVLQQSPTTLLANCAHRLGLHW